MRKGQPQGKQQSSSKITPHIPFNNSLARQMKIQQIPNRYSSHRIPHSHRQPQYIKTEHYPPSIEELPLPHSRNSVHTYSSPYSKVKSYEQHVTQQSIPLLKQRLKNIQEYYELMIAQVKNKNSERGEVILEVVDEMQLNHNQKIKELKRQIAESEEQKRDVGFVDDRMNQIKGNIEELISHSNQLKLKNAQLQKKIEKKRKYIEERESELEELNSELLEVRGEIEHFQINNLKNNKFNRQVLDIFSSASNRPQDD